MDTCQMAIVGACGRGASFRAACEALGNIRITAICDINEDELANAAERLGAEAVYTDYERMLEESAPDAVIIGTPMQWHAPMAIQALTRGISVLSEVTAAISIEEAKQLVEACNASSGVYMMAENYTYMRPNAIVREMVCQGEFGTPYYAEGEYIHELKGLNEKTTWRRKWQTGIAGVTYGTHSLGPILQWMPGDRVVRVCCAGSGHHYTDPRGNAYENDDSTVMLCDMQSGGLVKIRVDMISDRPHAMTNYQLQGTHGCYESARSKGEKHRVWLRSRTPEPTTWEHLEDVEDAFVPTMWREHADAAEKAGHGGGDYFEIFDFMAAVQGDAPPPIGIHQAMDMTLPGLISQQSILQKGAWMDVPDSREW